MLESAYASGKELVSLLPVGNARNREAGRPWWDLAPATLSDEEASDLALYGFAAVSLDDPLLAEIAAGRTG